MIRRATIGIVAVAVLASACSTGPTTGTPTPATSASSSSSDAPSSSSQALPYAGAPKVQSPLPASALAGDPCSDALTPDQVTQAMGAQVQGEPNTIDRIGPSCEWFNPDTTGKVTITYVTQTHTGLSADYQNSKPGDSAWKELPSIQGFPAVAHNKVTSSCQVSVGLADDLSIDVTVHLGLSKGGGKSDPCEVAPQVAALAVTTLKQKAGA